MSTPAPTIPRTTPPRGASLNEPAPVIGIIDSAGQQISVSCRTAFDGVEHVGRLWFAPVDGSESAIPDRAAIPGRSREAVVALAQALSPYELTVRHRRAIAEKRRYLALRRVVDEMIVKVRYMNQIAISVRGGLIDSEGARQELELTEQQIIDCARRLKDAAGQEAK